MTRGRPRLPDEVVALVLDLRRTGMGYGTIARKLGIGRTTVVRIASHGKVYLNSSEGAGGPGT